MPSDCGKFPEDEKLIFGPDKNLGNYINSITGRQMLLWDGACHVHEEILSVEKIIELKNGIPMHRYWFIGMQGAVAKLADKIGSTAGLLKYAMASDKKDFIVATESGILYEMRKKCSERTLFLRLLKTAPALPASATSCAWIRLKSCTIRWNTNGRKSMWMKPSHRKPLNLFRKCWKYLLSWDFKVSACLIIAFKAKYYYNVYL